MKKQSEFSFYEVEENFQDVRIDRWIRKKISDFPQSFIEKLLNARQITVNDNKIKSNFRLTKGDSIKMNCQFVLGKNSRSYSKVDPKYVELVRKNVIFEDSNLIAINKMAKFAVQGGSKIKLSIDDILPYLSKDNNQIKLVHRLDKDTSGILLLAKNDIAARILSKSFQNKEITKQYYAILTNIPENPQGTIANFVKKISLNGKERMIVCGKNDQGGEAITSYKVLKKLKNEHCLVEFKPITGRTHQLRLHAEMLNCPILGDKKYGLNVSSEKNFLTKVDNLFLHAKSISLGKIFGNLIKISTDLPIYFEKFIEEYS